MAESSVARVTAALATHGLEHVQLREFDERTATAVRFVQTTGGRTGLPAPPRGENPRR